MSAQNFLRPEIVSRDIERSIEMVQSGLDHYFDLDGMKMSRYYNPFTGEKSDEIGSVWMYTSAMEAVNSIMGALKAQKESGDAVLYDKYFDKFVKLFSDLYEGSQYYKGTFELVSYTQTHEWSVYAVNRAKEIGTANVTGVLNVYDDQMWFIRELIEAFSLTGDQRYFKEAEYLTEYVMDGWDCTLDEDGNENGGITWGPGYTSKHSCSNGPFVSPLVWLHEIYKGKPDEITYGYILPDKTRAKKTQNKAEYYLEAAKKVYAFQKKHLLNSQGVYDDMCGSSEKKIGYEEVNGQVYRRYSPISRPSGAPLTYNSGTMLSGGADLYRATSDEVYRRDIISLTDSSFAYFAKLGQTLDGYYTYRITGFNNWFNDVIMRGYIDVAPYYDVALPVESFQRNLDYAYGNFLFAGILPTNLLEGWNPEKGRNRVEAMFTFAFASEYAAIARYILDKNHTN